MHACIYPPERENKTSNVSFNIIIKPVSKDDQHKQPQFAPSMLQQIF